MTVSCPPIGRAQQPVASALPREFDPLRQERALESCSSQRAASVTHNHKTPQRILRRLTRQKCIWKEVSPTCLCVQLPPSSPCCCCCTSVCIPLAALCCSPLPATVGPGRPQPVCPRGTQTGPSAIQCWHRTLLECYRLVES